MRAEGREAGRGTCARIHTHTHAHTRPQRALPPSAQVWQMQTQASERWHDNPLIAHDCGLLSADCIDLLDKMFELEERDRWGWQPV